MKRPRPNESILVENEGHLRHCRRASKQTMTTNGVETKSVARASLNLLFFDVAAMWQRSGETVDGAWRSSRLGWPDETERFTLIRLSKISTYLETVAVWRDYLI